MHADNRLLLKHLSSKNVHGRRLSYCHCAAPTESCHVKMVRKSLDCFITRVTRATGILEASAGCWKRGHADIAEDSDALCRHRRA
jgi:hypothetical protein